MFLATAPLFLIFSITIRSFLATDLVTALAVRHVTKTKEFKGNPMELSTGLIVFCLFGGLRQDLRPIYIYMYIYIYGTSTPHLLHFAPFAYACTEIKTT